MSLRAIAAEEHGLLLYLAGQEGRGIGLANKLRAYVLQHEGADTVDANLQLGLPVDARDYGPSALVLEELGIRSVRLLTNNPAKVRALRAHGIRVEDAVPIHATVHARSLGYLLTKRRRMGHEAPPALVPLEPDGVGHDLPVDVTALLRVARVPADRPTVVLKYAQTLDGRIAACTGDSRWISGQAERRVSHALRAACDGVLVGIGTVLSDDPRLTVRLAPGPSPIRIVLDSKLRLSPLARVLDEDASTVVVTTPRSSPARPRSSARGRRGDSRRACRPERS